MKLAKELVVIQWYLLFMIVDDSDVVWFGVLSEKGQKKSFGLLYSPLADKWRVSRGKWPLMWKRVFRNEFVWKKKMLTCIFMTCSSLWRIFFWKPNLKLKSSQPSVVKGLKWNEVDVGDSCPFWLFINGSQASQRSRLALFLKKTYPKGLMHQ